MVEDKRNKNNVKLMKRENGVICHPAWVLHDFEELHENFCFFNSYS